MQFNKLINSLLKEELSDRQKRIEALKSMDSKEFNVEEIMTRIEGMNRPYGYLLSVLRTIPFNIVREFASENHLVHEEYLDDQDLLPELLVERFLDDHELLKNLLEHAIFSGWES